MTLFASIHLLAAVYIQFLTLVHTKFSINIFSGICASCGISIDGEASLVGKSHYHPKCFICADCKKPLGTTKYYIIDGKNYCAQDRYVSQLLFAFLYKKSFFILFQKTSLIFSCPRVVQNIVLYFLVYPMISFQKFLEKCTKCGEVIENETVRPKDSGKPFHADCFCCSKCTKPLQGKYFNTENGMFCEDCYSVSSYYFFFSD